MKVTIDIDCTPAEARQFMGLPDVEPMQKAMLAEMERRMMAEMERFSPESMMKSWFSAMPGGVDMMRDMFNGIFAAARDKDGEKK